MGERSRLIKSAEIVVDGAPIPCVVLDISPNGAHVYLASEEPIPPRVELRLPGGVVRTAHLRWRRQADMGFEFAFELGS